MTKNKVFPLYFFPFLSFGLVSACRATHSRFHPPIIGLYFFVLQSLPRYFVYCSTLRVTEVLSPYPAPSSGYLLSM